MNKLTNKVKKYTASVSAGAMMLSTMIVPSFAAGEIAEKINEIVNSVYGEIAAVATGVAALCAVICFFIYMYSKNEKNVDSAMHWLKRILIGWAAIVLVGLIVSFFTGIIGTPGGKIV